MEKQNKYITENQCDLIALTCYEGGDPVEYTTDDNVINDWLKDEEHSFFPVDLCD